MTVENTQNKMPPLQMGTATEYPFTFAVLLQDPTEEEALKAIKANVLQADGTEIELVYGVDYTVNLNTDRAGGTLFVKDVRTSGDYLTIYREYTHTQEVDYQDLNAAPAETFEQCFDKLTMLSQQQQEAINRSLKLNVSSTTVSPTLPEPIANNTLIWDSEGASLKNYDIISENNAFKEQVNENFATEKENIQKQFDVFEDEVNTKIELVSDAAEKINALDESIALCQESAANAANQAQIAAEKAEEILNVKDELEAEVETRANTSLDNLTEEGEKHFLGKSNITNCITEIPQRIKLELNSGVLTLKAGSISTVPYGTEDLTGQYPVGSTFLNDNFKVYETQFANGKFFVWAEVQSDMECVVATDDITAKCFVDFASNTFRGNASDDVSNNVAPTINAWWYDTANNTLGYWNATSQQFVRSNCSLPLAIATSVSQKFTSIDQVFNGRGYIGSTVWVDKGVKGLAYAGRNPDGTLKNKEVVFDNISISPNISPSAKSLYYIYARPNNSFRHAHKQTHFEQNGTPTLSSVYASWYSPVENVLKFTNDKGVTWDIADGFISVADVVATSNTITEFNPKQTFRAVDYNDSSTVSGWAFPSDKYIDLEFGASGSQYTAPANGWFVFNSFSTSNARSHLSAENIHSLVGMLTTCYTTQAGNRVMCPAKKGDKIGLYYSNVDSGTARFIYAEGEV